MLGINVTRRKRIKKDSFNILKYDISTLLRRILILVSSGMEGAKHKHTVVNWQNDNQNCNAKQDVPSEFNVESGQRHCYYQRVIQQVVKLIAKFPK